MMDDYCAPQWADFTCSPQIPSDSYFNIEHEVHEPQPYFKTAIQSNLPLPHKEEKINQQSVNETKFEDSLESEFSPCSNVAYFIPHDNKKHPVEEATQENQLSKGIKDMKLDERSSKIHQTWSISVTELTSAFKVTKLGHKVKTTVPERIKKNICMLTKDKSSLKNVQTNDIKKKNNFIKIKNEPVVQSKIDYSSEDDLSEKKLPYKIVLPSQIQPNSFKIKRHSLGKSQPKVLTCQYRRRSLIKYRRCSKQFVSLAEAVSKFQTGTPQRFRTLSNKELKPGALIKLKRSPLKLTYPVSPALRCKQRTRHTTILNQQEREKLELEEMKKHQIKANPVPVNILKRPSVLKKVAKKSTTVTEEFHLTQSKKTCHTTHSHLNLQQNTNDEEHKQLAPITRSVSASNVGVKKENVEAKRFSFEIRNKEFQMRKEERLKNLHIQETNKIKAEFHARPAPKFSRPANPAKEQNTKRRTVVQCPFSFEERNKCLAKKKEELVKQMQDKGKKTRVFHANPVPSFKPVMVHGLSKENLRSKEKTNVCKGSGTRQTKSCNDQENKQPNIMENTIICIDTKKKETKEHVVNCKADKKQVKTSVNVPDTKNKKLNAPQKKPVKFELNTNKRAKERNEFDEKIRKKEQELEAKRLEEEKNRLLKEKLERAELRKMAEVKAKPMPVYKCMVIAKSTKPPTSPKSPAIGYRAKAKSGF